MKKSELRKTIKESLLKGRIKPSMLVDSLRTQFQIAFESGAESGEYHDFEKFWEHRRQEIIWKVEDLLK